MEVQQSTAMDHGWPHRYIRSQQLEDIAYCRTSGLQRTSSVVALIAPLRAIDDAATK